MGDLRMAYARAHEAWETYRRALFRIRRGGVGSSSDLDEFCRTANDPELDRLAAERDQASMRLEAACASQGIPFNP